MNEIYIFSYNVEHLVHWILLHLYNNTPSNAIVNVASNISYIPFYEQD